jgi:hypothetical protein
MIKREVMTQIKWMFLALCVSFVLVVFFEGTVVNGSIVLKAQNTFLGLNLFLEILIFFAFSTFVVFGTKSFFELYYHKLSNCIVFLSGSILLFIICILCYQILIQE